MSQPQNLRADELQHSAPLAPVASPTPTPDDLVALVSVATPRLRSVGGRSGDAGSYVRANGGGPNGGGTNGDRPNGGGFTSGPSHGGRPDGGRSDGGRSDGGRSEHIVPATVRHADNLTEGALALRLQAIRRLGVVSSPSTLATLTALTTRRPQIREVSVASSRRTTLARSESAVQLAPGETAVQSAQPEVAVQSTQGEAAVQSAQPEVGGRSTHGEGAIESVEDRAVELVRGEPTQGRARAEQATGGPRLTALPGGGEPEDAPAEVSTAPGLRVVPDGAKGSVGGTAAGTRPGPTVPEARAWASRLVQAVSEVLAGDRPISQLVRFTDEVVFAELNRRVRLLGLNTTAVTGGAKEGSAVRSVRVCLPAADVAEVAAHVRHGERHRAIALRMEIRRNRWVCTALELG